MLRGWMVMMAAQNVNVFNTTDCKLKMIKMVGEKRGGC